MAPARILVLDPLTLIGRELLGCSDQLDTLVTGIDYLHAAEDDEHQIADVGTEPVLVSPLEAPEDLEGFDVIVVASDLATRRHDHLLAFLDSEPDSALVDIARLDLLKSYTTPSFGKTVASSRQLRVAHPALTATSTIIEVLESLGRLGGSVAAVDPVSVSGRDAVECLAQQARLRIQGAPVEERIGGQILAFNLVAEDSEELQTEASQLMPETPLAVTYSRAGFFHGHLAHLSLTFTTPVELETVREVLSLADGIEEASTPLSLDTVVNRNEVVVTPPRLSLDRQHLSLTAMADGLRIGGALTTIDILESLI